MRISVETDRKAALLEGRELGPRIEIEVSKEQMGEYWQPMVEALDLSTSPAQLRRLDGCSGVKDTTVEEVKRVVQFWIDQKEQRRVENRKALDEYRKALAALEIAVNAEPRPVRMFVDSDLGNYGKGSNVKGWNEFSGFELELPGFPYMYFSDLPETNAEFQVLAQCRTELTAQRDQKLKTLNDAAFAAALPEISERKARAEAEKAEAEAREAQEKMNETKSSSQND